MSDDDAKALVESLRASQVERRAKLLELLRGLNTTFDPETAHGIADDALLAYIADPEIEEAFNTVEKWYA